MVFSCKVPLRCRGTFLNNGNRRFREIERSIPGITKRILSKELKDMELNKLIKRTVYSEIPVLIEYEPTTYCRTFGGIIQEMIRWGQDHDKVIKNTIR